MNFCWVCSAKILLKIGTPLIHSSVVPRTICMYIPWGEICILSKTRTSHALSALIMACFTNNSAAQCFLKWNCVMIFSAFSSSSFHVVFLCDKRSPRQGTLCDVLVSRLLGAVLHVGGGNKKATFCLSRKSNSRIRDGIVIITSILAYLFFLLVVFEL